MSAGGPSRTLLEPFDGCSFGDAVVLRLLAGVHHLVLSGLAPSLAAHYPSVGGTPGRTLGVDFLDVLEAHQVELAESLTRPVQTNEVGRSVALLCGYLALGRQGLPLRVLEVGASAGLNLWFDRYRYETDGGAVGPASSPLRFRNPFVGTAPDLAAMPVVAHRRGCDPNPIAVGEASGQLRLRSLVWPDQADRRARLDHAIECIAAEPMAVDTEGGLTWCERNLAETAEGQLSVVVHSIVLQYMDPIERRRFVRLIEEAGARATPRSPFAWLRMEPAGDLAETRLTTWPGGTTRVVATSGYHGPPVRAIR